MSQIQRLCSDHVIVGSSYIVSAMDHFWREGLCNWREGLFESSEGILYRYSPVQGVALPTFILRIDPLVLH